MKENELKNLERKLFSQYFEDGFWDMYIRWVILAFGLTIISDISYLVGVFAALGIFIPKSGKSKYTYPRIGYIKFRGTRRKNITYILLGVFGLGLFAFFIFGQDQTSPLAEINQDNFLLVIGLVWGGACQCGIHP